MTDPTRDALDSIRSSVEQAVAAGGDVRRATETALRSAGDQIEAGGARFARAAESALHGAVDGAKKAGGDADGPLREVLEGLGDAVSSAANASRLAMQEAVGSGRRFAEEDLRHARDEMSTLAELFGRTLTDSLGRVTGRSRDAIKDLEQHAARVAERVGPSVRDAMQAAVSDPVALARETAEVSVKATGAVVSSVFESMGRLLEDTGRAMGGSSRADTTEKPKDG